MTIAIAKQQSPLSIHTGKLDGSELERQWLKELPKVAAAIRIGARLDIRAVGPVRASRTAVPYPPGHGRRPGHEGGPDRPQGGRQSARPDRRCWPARRGVGRAQIPRHIGALMPRGRMV